MESDPTRALEWTIGPPSITFLDAEDGENDEARIHIETKPRLWGVRSRRRRFTVSIQAERGMVAASGHFDNDIAGYTEAVSWVNDQGPVERWRVENAASLGRHLTVPR